MNALPCRWDGEALRPVFNFLAIARDKLELNIVYDVSAEKRRSDRTHRHEFAWLNEAHASLPEPLARLYPSVEHLRKAALIATGWCSTTDYVCGSRAEAARWAVNLRRELDAYAVVEISESVIRVHKARSQARNAMGAAEFQASKSAVLEWVAGLLDVAPADLAVAA